MEILFFFGVIILLVSTLKGPWFFIALGGLVYLINGFFKLIDKMIGAFFNPKF